MLAIRKLLSILNIINSFNTYLDSGVSPEGAPALVLVFPEGAVDRHSDVSPNGATAQVHVTNFVNRLYSNVADVLDRGAVQFAPSHKTLFYKFWWSHELDILKERCIESGRIW